MNQKFPLASIIMNCHNGQEFLSESIKSLLSQTYENWELIFWDNLSSDNSKKILEKFSDKRIKYFKSSKFTKLYEARNLAIQKCKGEYVGFLDTDDLWMPDKLQKQISFLKKNKKFRIVYSNHYILENKKNKKYIKYKMKLPSGSITQKLLDCYSLGILTVFLEKNIFEKFKFNKNYNIAGDFDFFINISQKFEIGSMQEPLAVYRIHESSFSSKKDIYIQEVSQWIKMNEKKLLGLGLSLKQQKISLLKMKIKYFFNRFFWF